MREPQQARWWDAAAGIRRYHPRSPAKAAGRGTPKERQRVTSAREGAMIVRKQDDGSLMLVAQTEHSRMVGQFAAHCG